MDLINKVLGDSQDVRLYRPQFKKILGSTNAAILLNQVIYWWQNSGYTAFYKFKEPCNHKMYKTGHSWCEELAFTKREFDGAIDKLKEFNLVETKRDKDNKLWYSVKDENLKEFCIKAFSNEKVDKLGHIRQYRDLDLLQKILKEGGTTEDIAIKALTLLGINPEDFLGSERTNCYLQVNHLLLLSSYRRITKNIFLNGINSVGTKFELIEPVFKPTQPEEKKMNFDDLVRKTGNADIAEKLLKNMPKPKAGAKPSFGQVVIAWKSAYGEISNSFCGGLTKKDEAQLKHIFKDYPSDAASIVKHCVFDWATFRNTVIRDKGLSNAPAVPTISFLSTYREIAHKVYTGGETATVAPAQTNQASEIEQLGLTSAEDFLRTL